ncbi:hypothetical protein BX666DRAFT_1892633 [Dichotomocladium elegans]|nr:hypothetical protein BX666DRAFT_1892633 [Dichotomocladium elegans]
MYEGISDGATSPVDVGSTTRSVIPSKRAAQNRAAQRAFRQRRDKYVKDLERKVKEMEGWPEEIEQLRNENRQLRDKVAAMHLQIAKLVGQTPTSMMSASSASSIGSADMGQPCQQQYQHHHQPSVQHHPLLVEAAPVAVASPPTSPPDRSPPPPPASFKSTHTIPPVSLRTSHNLSVAPAGSSHSEGGYAIAPVMEQHVNRDEIWALDNFELEFAFDSYFQDDAKPMTTGVDSGIHQQHQHQPNMNNNSGQVLDNLFEMLQTRQRPQIPIRSSSTVDLHPFLPSQTTSYVIPVPPSGSCYH